MKIQLQKVGFLFIGFDIIILSISKSCKKEITVTLSICTLIVICLFNTWTFGQVLGQAQLVKDININHPQPDMSPTALTRAGDLLFFVMDDGKHGLELWKSDGTEEGTAMVKDIYPGVGYWGGGNNSNPTVLTNINGMLYFQANDGVHGTELWKSDGTEAGTLMVKDIEPGALDSYPGGFTDLNGTTIFRAQTRDNGGLQGLFWKTDGTEAGTEMLLDPYPSTNFVIPIYWININGTLFFYGDDLEHGYELWKSDGTKAGTKLIKDITPGKGANSIDLLTNVNGTLYFRMWSETYGHGLWKSDGTEAGTVMVKQGVIEGNNALVEANGILYFNLNDAQHGNELWKTDGTETGTTIVKDIHPTSGSFPISLFSLNNILYFLAIDESHGKELWKTDGTEEGTVMVKDINPEVSTGRPVESLTNAEGQLYFRAYDPSHGYELWKSDGTEDGTVLVRDILSGVYHSYPKELTYVNGTLFFTAHDGVHGRELWKYIVKLSQKLAFELPDSLSYQTEPITLTATSVSGLPINFVLVSGPGILTGNLLTITGVGKVIVKAIQTGNDTYAEAEVIQSITIQKANQKIAFTAIAAKTYQDAPFELQALASSGLPVTFSVLSGLATLSEKTLTITGAGQITVKASQAGNDTYYEASAEQTFTVNKASQIITFSSLADTAINEAPVELVATSSSGLPVSFSVVLGKASIENNILTVQEPGQITVQALQQGNDNYMPAASVEQSFTVSAVLGLEDEVSAKVKLFPNPVSDLLYLTLPEELQKASIRILDLKGRVVGVQQVNGKEKVQFQVGGLPKGLYLMQIYNSKHSISRKFSIH